MNAREWLRRQRSTPAATRQPAQRQLFLESADALFLELADAIESSLRTPRGATSAPADEGPAYGCWPQYTTCRCPARAENGV